MFAENITDETVRNYFAINCKCFPHFSFTKTKNPKEENFCNTLRNYSTPALGIGRSQMANDSGVPNGLYFDLSSF